MVGLFRALQFGPSVEQGDNLPVYCSLEGVAKMVALDRPFLAANEFIAARLGHLMGVPTVPGIVLTGGANELGFISLRFGPRNERPPPVLPEEFVREHPDVALGTIVFDCWIANDDRHDENLASHEGASYLFDHDRALLGQDRDLAATARVPHHMLARHCLAAEIDSAAGLGEWIAAVEQIGERALRAAVLSAVWSGALPAEHELDVRNIISFRRQHLRAMLNKAYHDGIFKRLKQWDLLSLEQSGS
jgi:hypothetical protein